MTWFGFVHPKKYFLCNNKIFRNENNISRIWLFETTMEISMSLLTPTATAQQAISTKTTTTTLVRYWCWWRYKILAILHIVTTTSYQMHEQIFGNIFITINLNFSIHKRVRCRQFLQQLKNSKFIEKFATKTKKTAYNQNDPSHNYHSVWNRKIERECEREPIWPRRSVQAVASSTSRHFNVMDLLGNSIIYI